MEEKSVREKGKTCHSIWSNYCAAFSWMGEYEGVRYFPLQGMHVVLAVAQPFFAMTLPGAVVYLLGSGWEAERIFFALAGYVFILQGMQVAVKYLERYCRTMHMDLRLKLGTPYFGNVINLANNLDNLEDEGNPLTIPQIVRGFNFFLGQPSAININTML